MALKLLLLSSEAIEDIDLKEFISILINDSKIDKVEKKYSDWLEI